MIERCGTYIQDYASILLCIQRYQSYYFSMDYGPSKCVDVTVLTHQWKTCCINVSREYVNIELDTNIFIINQHIPGYKVIQF